MKTLKLEMGGIRYDHENHELPTGIQTRALLRIHHAYDACVVCAPKYKKKKKERKDIKTIRNIRNIK